MRASIVLNADAGAMSTLPVEDVVRTVNERFAANGWTVHVALVAGRAVSAAIDAALASPAEAVIVGGGDGTVSRAIAKVAASGKIFGVLPLGTVNLLARDLRVPNEIDAAIDRLCGAEPQTIDLGTINGRLFHSISGLGFFGRMARERERARRTLPLPRSIAFTIAALRSIAKSGVVRLAIHAGSETRLVEATAVLVTNNRFVREDWRRSRLNEGVLEIHMLGDHKLMHRLRAGLDVVRGAWRSNPTIETIAAEAVEVRSSRSRIWVATDGELSREGMPLRYGIRRGALTLLVPKQEAASAEPPAAA